MSLAKDTLEAAMTKNPPRIPLPKTWPAHVASAVLHVISLAQFATAYTRSWAACSLNARVRLKAQLDRANQEIALLREEIRIKDARMARIDPNHRSDCPPTERIAGSTPLVPPADSRRLSGDCSHDRLLDETPR